MTKSWNLYLIVQISRYILFILKNIREYLLLTFIVKTFTCDKLVLFKFLNIYNYLIKKKDINPNILSFPSS